MRFEPKVTIVVEAPTDSDGRLKLWSGRALPEWADYNGHVTEHRYLQVLGDATDGLLKLIGVVFDQASAGSFYTLESHIRHLKECHPGDLLETTTELLGYDEKRIHYFHRIFQAPSGTLLASGEHVSLHVAHGKAGPATPAMQERIAAIFEAQAHVPPPDRVGSVLLKPLAHSRLHGSSGR